MSEFNISDLEEKDLYDLVEEGSYLEKLLEGRGGDIIKRASQRVIDRHERKFVFDNEQTDQKTTEYKVAMKFYKYNLFEAFNLLIEDGKKADEEIKFRKEQYEEPTSNQGDEQDS